MTNAFWSILGYAAALLLAMIPVGGMILLTRTKAWRHRRGIRAAGWAPWWYVGGQAVGPEELQEGTESES